MHAQSVERLFWFMFCILCSQVLYSEHAVTENYPEDTLLPDYAAMERERNEVSLCCSHAGFV